MFFSAPVSSIVETTIAEKILIFNWLFNLQITKKKVNSMRETNQTINTSNEQYSFYTYQIVKNEKIIILRCAGQVM